MTTEPTNTDRAAWAKNALAVFTAETYSGDQPDSMGRHDLDAAISDLIADLLHYASQQALDAGNIMQRACGHFGYELLDEACRKADIAATIRMQEGYDHSYFFVSSFIDDHIAWHAERLTA